MAPRTGIELSAEQRQQAIASIKQYVGQELDQDLGDLKAGYVLKEIVPSVYTRAMPTPRPTSATGSPISITPER
jgi:hypothetical protein